MRHWLALAGILGMTACASVASSRELPVLSPRMLDTAVTVGTPDDRRVLGEQVQRCYARQAKLIQSDENERVSAIRKRAVILSAIGGGGSFLLWLALTHPRIGADAIGLSLAATIALQRLSVGILPPIPPNRDDLRERAWSDVVHQVEAWETAANDWANARREVTSVPNTASDRVESARLAWQHADAALRASLTTCLGAPVGTPG